MSDHDKFCPVAAQPRAIPAFCRCDEFAKVRADQNERIAAAIDDLAKVADIRWRNEQHVYWEGARDAHRDAARIARSGGTDG